jgi:iron complex outermembrane receptor protein
MPRVVAALGQPEFQNERLRGFEAGYRAAVVEGLTVDVVTYLNYYSDLLSSEPGPAFFDPSPVPHLVLPRYRSNMMAARTAGVEVSTVWAPVSLWRLEGAYSRFHIDPRPMAGSVDPTGPVNDGNTPKHQASLRSRLSLTPQVDFDVNLFAVGRLRELNIPAYNRLDLRLGWKAPAGLELALTGQDLLRKQHAEFGGLETESSPTDVPRTVELEVTWQF